MPLPPLPRFFAASVLAGAAVLSPVVASAASLTEALAAAPADAEVVIAFPSLQGFSAMVGRLAETVGLDDEGTEDVLGGFKREFGFEAGVDDAGAGLVVFRGIGAAMEAGPGGDAADPTAFLVLPVSDYEAFVGALEKPVEAGDTPEGVTAVLIDGDPSLVRNVGSYAVLSEEGEPVADYEAANAAAAALSAMGGYAADAGSPDAALWLNVDAMRAGVRAAADRMVRELSEGVVADGPGMIGLAFAPLSGSVVRGLTDSVDGLLLTARMTPDRVALDAAARVKPDSPAAAYLTGERSDPLALLGRLPDAPFLTAQATDLAAVNLDRVYADTLAAANAGAARLEAMEGGAEMAGAFRAVAEAWAAMTRPAEGAGGAKASAKVNYASDPQAMMTGGLFQTLTATSADDAGALKNAFPGQIDAMRERLAPAVKDFVAAMDEQDQLVGGRDPADAGAEPAGAAPEVAVTGSYNADALTLAGAAVDQYQVSFVLPPAMVEGMGPAGFLLGNAGVSGFVAAVDGVFLQTASADPGFMERALQTAQGGAGAPPAITGSPSMEGAADAMPGGLVAAGYGSLQGLGQTYNAFAPFVEAFLGPMPPVDVPVDLAPLSLGVGMESAADGGHDLGVRLNVPVGMLEFFRDTYQQFAPAAGGGEDFGGGGPPPAPF